MLQYYHGQGFASWTLRSVRRRCTEPSLPHRFERHTKQVKTRPASPTQSSCEDRFRERNGGTWVNVSGKKYFFTFRLLSKFPNSLLADPQKRCQYYDSDRDEVFFDRNRIAFDSVYIFYQTSGMLMTPDEYFPEQLLTDEFYFFGLYEYLSPYDSKFKLVTPSALKKQHNVPKRKCQREMWKICEHPGSSIVARVVNLFSLVIVVLSAVLLFVGTLPSFKPEATETRVPLTSNITSFSKRNFTLDNLPVKSTYTSIIYWTETGCIVWFTLELLVRFLVSPEKCQFLLSSSSIIDFIAIAPFYVSVFANRISFGTSLYVLRVIRLSRVFRVLKISRYSSAMTVLGKTAKASFHDLSAMFFLIFIGTILFGSIAYYCEQWDEETKFHGIPHGCWWAAVTISTVGYGDLVPTTLGK